MKRRVVRAHAEKKCSLDLRGLELTVALTGPEFGHCGHLKTAVSGFHICTEGTSKGAPWKDLSGHSPLTGDSFGEALACPNREVIESVLMVS